jgi:hypothetical protein
MNRLDEMVAALREISQTVAMSHPRECHRLVRMANWLEQSMAQARDEARENTEGATHREPKTTEATAALLAKPRTGTQRALILEALWGALPDGLTFDEIKQLPGVADNAHRIRTRELVLGGHVLDSGRTRENRRGNDEVVWVAVVPGEDAA